MSQAAALSRAVSLPAHIPESAVYVYEQMLSRLPPFRLDPDHPPKFHGGHVIGVDTLCLLWETHT
jgi:hypothetical protein